MGTVVTIFEDTVVTYNFVVSLYKYRDIVQKRRHEVIIWINGVHIEVKSKKSLKTTAKSAPMAVHIILAFV